ncbi:MAG: DciA family protein [Gaiellaceae bacterium]
MERLGDRVRSELGRFGPTAGMAALLEAWPRVVGDAIARSAWPARLARDGTLYVHTVDSIWAFELTARAEEIAARLGVASARFAPGRLPERSAEEVKEARPDPVRAGEREREEASRLAAAISDESLRKVVAKAAAASLARAAADRGIW